jgi:hypothetical protein
MPPGQPRWFARDGEPQLYQLVEESVSLQNRIKITRLAATDQRYLLWPTDEIGEIRTKSELATIPQKKP